MTAVPWFLPAMSSQNITTLRYEHKKQPLLFWTASKFNKQTPSLQVKNHWVRNGIAKSSFNRPLAILCSLLFCKIIFKWKTSFPLSLLLSTQWTKPHFSTKIKQDKPMIKTMSSWPTISYSIYPLLLWKKQFLKIFIFLHHFYLCLSSFWSLQLALSSCTMAKRNETNPF